MTSGKSVTWNANSPVAAGRERQALLELSIGYGLILLAVWTPHPWQWPVNFAALAWVFMASGTSFEGWSAMGFRMSGSLRSLWVVGLALLLAAVAASVADRLHTLHSPETPALFIKRYWGYTIWAFLQEFLLLNFVLLRLLKLLPTKKAAVLAAAGLFAFAHLPNPILTPVTLIWGYAACWLFLHYRNLYTLALAHAIFGICIATTVPGPITHHMKVGLGYLAYRPTGHHRSQSDEPEHPAAGPHAANLPELSLRPKS